MLNFIKIKNFKSIKDTEIQFNSWINNIIWNNWVWKTNILLSILHLFLSSKTNIDEEITIWENILYLSWEFEIWSLINQITFSYDKVQNKKLFTLNSKKVTKKFIQNNILKVSFFSPITMNLFYLWPKYRRDFLDDIILICFWEYKDLLSDYEKILKSRNKILKNILEWNSKKSELDFWDEKFVFYSEKIYKYRLDLINFFKSNMDDFKNIFWSKVNKVSIIYKTKVYLENISGSIKDYLSKNLDRDIILWKTHIWPHIDDFEIFVDDFDILNFASRWEIKSIIIYLKLLEIDYIKGTINKNPILLIDDLNSELDDFHQNLIINKTKNLQLIITSISPIWWENTNIIKI